MLFQVFVKSFSLYLINSFSSPNVSNNPINNSDSPSVSQLNFLTFILLSEMLNIIYKPLARQIITKREKINISSIRNERENIAQDSTGMKKIVREGNKQCYVLKFDSLGEMD